MASLALPFPPGEMAAGGGGLWVAEAAGPRVALIGERSGRVERTLRVRPGAEDAGPLAVGSGSLWLGRGPEVLRVAPRSGRVLARLRTPVDVTIVRSADDAVWAVDSQEGRVAKIDPATNRVVARNQLHGWVSALAVGGGFAWLGIVPEDVVFKLSADDLAVAGTSRAAPGPDRLAWDADRLWVSTGAGRSLIRIGGDGPQSPLRLDAIPVALAATGGLLWTATLPVPPPPRPPGKGGELRVAVAARRDRHRPGHGVLPRCPAAALRDVRRADGLPGRGGRPTVAGSYPRSPPSRRPSRATGGRTRSASAPGTGSRPVRRARDGGDVPLEHRAGAVAARSARRRPRCSCSATSSAPPTTTPGARGTCAGSRSRETGSAIRLAQPAGDLPARLALPMFCPVPDGTPAVRGRQPGAAAVGRPVLRRLPGHRPHRARSATRTTAAPGRAVRTASSTSPGSGPTRRSSAPTRARSSTSPTTTTSTGRSRWAARATGSSARRARRRAAATSGTSRARRPGSTCWPSTPRRPLFRDAAMRRAVNLAIDRPALAAVWNELPTDRYIPPAILPATGAPRYPVAGPDLRAARRLAAGRRGTATLYYCGEAPNRRVAEIVRANLRPIGIRVRITPSLACLRGPDPARDRADIVLVSPSSPVPDAERFLAFACGDDAEFGGQVLPRGAFDDPAFTGRLARGGPARGARPGGVVRRAGGGARRGRPARGVQQLRPAGVRLAAGRMPRHPGRPAVPRPRGGVRATGLAQRPGEAGLEAAPARGRPAAGRGGRGAAAPRRRRPGRVRTLPSPRRRHAGDRPSTSAWAPRAAAIIAPGPGSRSSGSASIPTAPWTAIEAAASSRVASAGCGASGRRSARSLQRLGGSPRRATLRARPPPSRARCPPKPTRTAPGPGRAPPPDSSATSAGERSSSAAAAGESGSPAASATHELDVVAAGQAGDVVAPGTRDERRGAGPGRERRPQPASRGVAAASSASASRTPISSSSRGAPASGAASAASASSAAGERAATSTLPRRAAAAGVAGGAGASSAGSWLSTACSSRASSGVGSIPNASTSARRSAR